MSSLTRHVYAPTANVNRFTTPVPVNKGGTGANNAVTAVENLGGIPKSKANLPNGWGQLDGDGKLPASVFPLEASGGPTIDGPDQLLIQKTGVFTITNYDSNEVYTITAAQGIVSRNGDTIYYTAPALEGAYGFVINGKAVSVNISMHYVSQPSIITPANTNAAISNAIVTDTLYADDRAIGDLFGVSVAVSADGQRLAIGAQSKTVSGLIKAGQVYIYIRSGSTWVLESTITASDKAANDGFGVSVSFSADGNRLAVGAYTKTISSIAGAGQVYIYIRSGSTWVLESTITASDKAANDSFGVSVSLSGDGSRLIVGAFGKTVSTIAGAGQVYSYTRSGSTWTEEAKISASDKATNDNFGVRVSLDSSASRLAIGAFGKTVNTIVNAGQVYVYTRSGSTWALETTLSASDKVTGDRFGQCVHFSSDGSRLLVGVPNKNNTNGKVYNYVNTNFGWNEEFFILPNDSLTSQLGINLALTADGLTLICGASAKDSEDVPNCGGVITYQLEYNSQSKNRQQSLINFTSSPFALTGQYLESKLSPSDGVSTDDYGWSVAITPDGSRMVVGAYNKTVSGLIGAGQAYVYTRSGATWVEEAKLMSPTKATDDRFGWSVSIDGAGSRIAVGSIYKTLSGLSKCGCVEFFTRTGTTWTYESILSASDKAVNDYYGTVALSNDGALLAVSSIAKDVSGLVDAGKVYIYTRSGSVWTEQSTLTASDKVAGDTFGYSLAFDSASSRLAVGAVFKTVSGLAQAGQAYVYTRSGTTWVEEAKITSSDKAAGDQFGRSVAFNASGDRLFIGAFLKNIAGVNAAGQMYHFTRSGTTWSELEKFTAPVKYALDHFGVSVALNSDASMMVVGLPNQPQTGDNAAGQVYTYLMSYHEGSDWQLATDPGFTNIIKSVTNSATNKTSWQVTDLEAGTDYYARCRHKGTTYGYSDWSPTCKLTTSDTFVPYFETTILAGSDKASGDSYGIAAALSNDGSRLAIGAYQKTVGAVTAAGQVYVYTRSGTTWTEEAKISASDKVASDYFGVSVAFDGNANRLAIGAHGKDVSGISNAGQVYVYTRSGSTWSIETTITASDKALNDYFGVAVAFDSVGSRLAVGAYGKDVSGIVDAGKVYVYTRTGSVYTQETTITASDKATNDLFGAGLSMNDDGSLLLVGAATKTVGGLSQAGQVYLLSRVGSTWTEIATLTAADKAANDRFGFGLAISRDSKTAVIGAYNRAVTASTMGKVYYYQLNGNTFTQVTSAAASDKVTGDLFGTSVALSDDAGIMAVGASSRDSGGVLNSGGAYIFY